MVEHISYNNFLIEIPPQGLKATCITCAGEFTFHYEDDCYCSSCDELAKKERAQDMAFEAYKEQMAIDELEAA